ncbi:hypothetical protein [Egicoccus halophilus]|uniref:Uncharacterized protein n=1 Tax=Egicoccus halophilus TaxID=1670830 RepID=A0A8J3A5V6_9ACTN|nr:hypothetical protein [Egicoccus halophilus]GGI03995.1 hypothetical protein GCM10011354_06840 [Egicoccus halophilus]
MTEMDGNGLSRRDVLQRAAGLGLSLSVATPLVQGLGRIPAFATASDVAAPPQPLPPVYRAPSAVQVAFRDPSPRRVVYALRHHGGAWQDLGRSDDCLGLNETIGRTGGLRLYGQRFDGTISPLGVDDGLRFTPPAGLEILHVALEDAAVSGGPAAACSAPVVAEADGTYLLRVPVPTP